MSKISILFIDDEEMLRIIAEDFFNDVGFRIISAENAEDGLIKLKTDVFDFCLVDLGLPRMSGDDFIINAYKESPDTHYIIMTGSGNYILTNELKGVNVTSSDLFIKPVDFGKIAEYISEVQNAKS